MSPWTLPAIIVTSYALAVALWVAMSKTSIVEIHIQNSEMLVAPSVKAFNHRKLARKISADVRAALDLPRSHRLSGIIIDMCHVSWISSVGVNELIHLRTAARAAGVGLRLRSLSETVADVIRLTRLERVFDIDGAPSKNSDQGTDAESTEIMQHESLASV